MRTRCIIVCFAVCAAMRPMFFGVTSSSISSPSCAFFLRFTAVSIEISSKGLLTFSTAISFANARIVPFSGSMSMRSSRAGPMLFFEAASRAKESTSTMRSRSIPFSFS